MKKIALITGGSGGVGGGFARILSKHGYHVLLPVRSLKKAEEAGLFNIPHTDVSLCEIDAADNALRYFQSLKNAGTIPSLFVLAAGAFAWDKDFPGTTLTEQQENAKAGLMKSNFLTKQNAFDALQVFGASQQEMTGIVISSHAARFPEGHPYRSGEEGYVHSMLEVSQLGERQDASGRFKRIFVEEPGRIQTASIQQKLTTETIGEAIDWSKEMTPDEFALRVLTARELI